MYHDKPRTTPAQHLRRALLAGCLLVAACAAVWAALRATRADLETEAALTLRRNVLSAAVQCYAVEGAYPESLAKLEQDYGVRINRNKFVVSYNVFASNVLPDVAVLQK